MIPLLLATAVVCADISEMVDRVNAKHDLTLQEKEEIIAVYQIHLVEATGLGCDWDAKAD